MKNREIAIVGLGVHPYGRWPDKSMAELGCYAIDQALEDAHMKWRNSQAQPSIYLAICRKDEHPNQL